MKQRISLTCLFAFIFITVTQQIFAVTITATVNNGNWSIPSTWNLNRVPANTDNVIIPENITVKITSNVYNQEVTLRPKLIIKIYGILKITGTNAQLNLGCGSTLAPYGCGSGVPGTGNSANQISIAGQVVWKGTYGSISEGDFLSATSNCPNNPLPVVISELSAGAVPSGIQIHWTTSSEENVDHFDVERSLDGITFEKQGAVNARGSLSEYVFIDHTVLPGKVYYRLKSIDIDGSYDWSEVISVEVPEARISTYPNPASADNLVLSAEDAKGKLVYVSIYDYSGKLHYSESFTYDAPARLNLTENMKAGFYLIEVLYHDTKHTEKIRLE